MLALRRPSLLVMALTFAYHASSPVSQQGDSRWTVFTALSLMREGNADLNEFPRQVEESGFYAIECVSNGVRHYPIRSLEECRGGRLYNFYPISASLLALPAVAVQFAALRLLHPWTGPVAAHVGHPVLKGYLTGDLAAGSAIVEIVAASAFVALGAALFLLLARQYLSRREAVVATIVFACCTPMLSVASRALWQHAASAALLTAMLLLLTQMDERPELCRYLGTVLALAFFVRPTAAVPIGVVGMYLVRHYRAGAVQAAVGALPIVALFVGINWAMYRLPLAPYFFPVRAGTTSLELHGDYGLALAGTIVSPARGVLVYMPFLLLIPLAWRWATDVHWRRLAPWVVAMLAGHWLLVALHVDWWGGHTFGPRYFSDVTPLLLFLTFPVITAASRQRVLGAAFAVLAGIAFVVHFRGSHALSTQLWNVTPVNVTDSPGRLWDWRDPPFLR